MLSHLLLGGLRMSEWPKVKFGDVVRLFKERSSDPLADGYDRYIGLDHIEPEDLRIRRWGNVADGVTFTSVFKPGQVLFGKRRAYQRKVAVADFAGVCSGDIYVLESKDPKKFLPELLPFICQTEAFFQHAVSTSAGSLSPRTNWTSLADFEFALPPLDEQRKILMAIQECDKISEYLHEAILAAHKNYDRFSLDCFAPNKAAYHDSDPTAVFDDSWSLVKLGFVTQSDSPICYGIVQVGIYDAEGVQTVAIKDLAGDFGDELHRSAPSIESNYVRSRIKGGDFLISVKAVIGEVAVVPDHFDGNISRDIARIRFNSTINPRYAWHLFRSAPYKRYIQKYVVGSTRDELSIGVLREMKIPVPPMAQQNMIITLLDSLNEATNNLSERSIKSRTLKKALLGAML